MMKQVNILVKVLKKGKKSVDFYTEIIPAGEEEAIGVEIPFTDNISDLHDD